MTGWQLIKKELRNAFDRCTESEALDMVGALESEDIPQLRELVEEMKSDLQVGNQNWKAKNERV